MLAMGQTKQAIRERVWARLEAADVVEPGVAGSIPNFAGADEAAERLADLPVWKTANVIKAVPDWPQLPARIRALEAGKLVYMAAPKLATERPFYVLDPHVLSVPASQAAQPKEASRIALTVDVTEMPLIDLVVVGSVAVNDRGARLGKGAGYADLEIALLAEAGLVTERTTIATTVHDLQVLDDDLPELDHDFRVDVVVTPERVIWCGHPKRPEGVDWRSLAPEQIATIPVLARRAGRLNLARANKDHSS
jgi:5-formyltetrahydrofolate cyclo-ligase